MKLDCSIAHHKKILHGSVHTAQDFKYITHYLRQNSVAKSLNINKVNRDTILTARVITEEYPSFRDTL